MSLATVVVVLTTHYHEAKRSNGLFHNPDNNAGKSVHDSNNLGLCSFRTEILEHDDKPGHMIINRDTL